MQDGVIFSRNICVRSLSVIAFVFFLMLGKWHLSRFYGVLVVLYVGEVFNYQLQRPLSIAYVTQLLFVFVNIITVYIQKNSRAQFNMGTAELQVRWVFQDNSGNSSFSQETFKL